MTHTKGKWKVVQDNDYIRTTDIKPVYNKFWYFTVYSQDCVSLEEHKANCRLVAAAPDLLEALETFEWNDTEMGTYSIDVSKVLKSIAKAKGK